MGINFRRAGVGTCCRDCKERYEACHDTCEAYQKWSREWDAYKKKINQAAKPNEYDLYKINANSKKRK